MNDEWVRAVRCHDSSGNYFVVFVFFRFLQTSLQVLDLVLRFLALRKCQQWIDADIVITVMVGKQVCLHLLWFSPSAVSVIKTTSTMT